MSDLIQLKGGFETSDPRLDRLPQFDERSRGWPVREVDRFSLAPVSRTWQLPIRLDQGREGACVGFSRSHDLAALPAAARGITNQTAQHLYEVARTLDEWPGEDYDGTSVLAGVKAARQEGYIGEFRWAFSIDDVLGAISSVGSVAFGLWWMDSMFDTQPDGTLDTSGSKAGGHAIIGRSVLYPRSGWVRATRTFHGVKAPVKIKTGEPVVGLANSWAEGWGILGEGFIHASRLEALLKDDGEACVSTVAFAKPRAAQAA
jgi:hypothetical protein